MSPEFTLNSHSLFYLFKSPQIVDSLGSNIGFLRRQKALRPSFEPTSGRLKWLLRIWAENQLNFCLWFWYLKIFSNNSRNIFSKIKFWEKLSINCEFGKTLHFQSSSVDTLTAIRDSPLEKGPKQTKVKAINEWKGGAHQIAVEHIKSHYRHRSQVTANRQ